MAGIVLNETAFIAKLNQYPRVLQRNYTRRLRLAIDMLTDRVLSRTPVYTGQTVRNWRWTMDAPSGGTLPAIGSGQPGQTSGMPLGGEPRRGPNQADAAATKDTLQLGRPWRRFFLSNNAPNVAALEAGAAPDPQRSRAPNGMLGISLVELETFLRQSKKGLLKP